MPMPCHPRGPCDPVTPVSPLGPVCPITGVLAVIVNVLFASIIVTNGTTSPGPIARAFVLSVMYPSAILPILFDFNSQKIDTNSSLPHIVHSFSLSSLCRLRLLLLLLLLPLPLPLPVTAVAAAVLPAVAASEWPATTSCFPLPI